ncbi:MAG TPA: TetR/AcrR family transcriptional regulator [Acidobacteriaceae bacterium]|nr:TetR/AcrR family transcriptional regulator [Acidobacteriaceae bacterium]
MIRAAYQEILRSGVRSADIDAILSAARVTKGALYHHFESKEAIGYAVVDEVIAGMTRDKWVSPLGDARDPVDALIGIVLAASLRPEDIEYGCPLNNVSQEMSPIDEGFRKRTAAIFGDWHRAIAAALRRGQAIGQVRSDVDVEEAAAYVIALYEGFTSLAKNSQDARVVQTGQKGMIRFLESLRAARRRRSKSD